jgi:predicted kinase
MKKVILMKGLPGSGKSTYAKKLISENPEQFKRINRDDLRAMFDNGFISKSNETFIRGIRDLLIIRALESGKSVIVDDTNLSEKNLTRITQLVHQHNKANNENVIIEVKQIETSVEECIKRDALRENPVGDKVIKTINRQFFKKTDVEYTTQNPNLPKAIICDLDGTLALMNGRNPFEASRCNEDLLNEPVGNVLKNYKNLGYKIILLSGREYKYKTPSLQFLEENSIDFDMLLMRKSDDNRKDSIIKREIYEAEIKDNYFIEFVLDDRNQVVDLWRNDLKLPCFQVYYGDF